MTYLPEQTENTSQTRETAKKKEKFDLCLGMLKAYYELLDSRVEKSFALLVVVIGWLITSTSVRESLQKESILFWAVFAALTATVLFLAINLSHFLKRFRQIQKTIEALDYIDPKYYARYRMPDRILPSYLAPVLILYAFIVFLLVIIKLKLM